VGTVETLVKELQRIIKKEEGRVQPVAAPLVASLCRRLQVLKTLPQKAVGFRESQTLSRDQLRVKYGEFRAAAKVALKQRAQVKLILSSKQRAKPAASRTRRCTNAAVCKASGECPSRF
jgi:hypothetical protein